MFGAAARSCTLAALLACASPAMPAAQQQASQLVAAHIDAASSRFAIPVSLIRAVIGIESAGRVHAVSPKGAMGLMQLMPRTWAMLRARYGLGDDPFDPRDNIVAGTAYLRELLNRYGDPGFLAAYNAGPGRYEAYLRGVPLPAETVAYVARLRGRDLDSAAFSAPISRSDTDAWRAAPLFARAGDDTENVSGSRPPKPLESPPATRPEASGDTNSGLFVRRAGEPQ